MKKVKSLIKSDLDRIKRNEAIDLPTLPTEIDQKVLD